MEKEYQELPVYPDKRTFWCRFYAGVVIGSFFLKGAHKVVNVNGNRYRSLWIDFYGVN